MEDFISEHQVAELIGKSVQTIRNWRWRSYGPRYLKIGHNVRYRRDDVTAWINGRVVDPEARAAGRAA